MKAYHQYMSGVDVHDQLRLQRYSVQLSLRFRKYYKSLALGLIDMAIINSFIIFRENCKMRGDPPADHASFIAQLHAQLLDIGVAEFADTMYSPGPVTPTQHDDSSIGRTHKLEMENEWVRVNGIKKRRQRQCKVGTIRKTVRTKRQVTRFYCPKCSNGSKRYAIRYAKTTARTTILRATRFGTNSGANDSERATSTLRSWYPDARSGG
ncbi:hypothetical protein PHMEG_0004370 [Phytophthora megakarya]|uniref:PiggyBac transposable element-derived protein domain-containing protein n=1 Tax=Phytophthora megakarya TaxID=4795 RepID=A0A225WU63_9STRA|nr:hypothetical protein PHMEG_0004370 [Phytophthora megakarya]